MNSKNLNFCVYFNSHIVKTLQKIAAQIKSSDVVDVGFYFSNYSQSVLHFSLEQKTSNIRIFFNDIIFYNEDKQFYDIVGKNINIDINSLNDLICKDNKSIYFVFASLDFINLVKCFDEEELSCAFVIFLLEKNIIKISCSFSASVIATTENSFVDNYKNNSQVIVGTNFCNVKDMANIFDTSYIICSNVYGRIVNKATCFMEMNDKYYCVNTNGRILMLKTINTCFKQQFSISIPKNISKFLINVDKDEKINIIVDKTCIFQCKNLEIEFQCVEQTHQVIALLSHKFDENIYLSSIMLDKVFNFFNKIKGITMENSISFIKSKNDCAVYCILKDSQYKIKNKIGDVEEKYQSIILNIFFSFDVFNLIKLILRRLISEKVFHFNFSYNVQTNSNFANINLNDIGVQIFFAIR